MYSNRLLIAFLTNDHFGSYEENLLKLQRLLKFTVTVKTAHLVSHFWNILTLHLDWVDVLLVFEAVDT